MAELVDDRGMRQPSPLPRGLTGTAFSTRSALEAGVSRRRLRASDLDTPFRGVRAPAGSTIAASPAAEHRRTAFLALCGAYCERAAPDEFFSHVTAARIWDLSLPSTLEERRGLDVAVFAPANPPQGEGVRGHRLSRATSLKTREGLPCVPPVEAWVELAALLSVGDLIVAGDALMRRKHPLAAPEQIVDALARSFRRPGTRRLRAAALLIRPGTDSPMETNMRLVLIRGGLPEPQIGYTVHDRDGFFVGTPDLAYVEEKIALDYEGDIHRVNKSTFREDIERREMFQDAGWRHIRVTNAHLGAPHRLVDRVSFALAQRRPSPNRD